MEMHLAAQRGQDESREESVGGLVAGGLALPLR
jgi:hypothetical protein